MDAKTSAPYSAYRFERSDSVLRRVSRRALAYRASSVRYALACQRVRNGQDRLRASHVAAPIPCPLQGRPEHRRLDANGFGYDQKYHDCGGQVGQLDA